MSAAVGHCPHCGEPDKLLVPLHGERGGPRWCLRCGTDWHGEHGRRRKLGRVVTKAIKAYFAAGGEYRDVDRLKLAASGVVFAGELDTLGVDVGDITTELLDAAVRLTHPDKHPPERHDAAQRVTQDLLALRPFTFPAPKRQTSEACNESAAVPPCDHKKPSRLEFTFPCETCLDQIPYYYCDACRAEWEKRQGKKREAERVKRRDTYRRRRLRELWMRGKAKCRVCGAECESERADAKYCSAACRQRAHRERVTERPPAMAAGGKTCHAAEVSP